MRAALAHTLSEAEVNQLGRDTGQSQRLRTVTPHRLFLSTIAGLADGNVDSLADLLRTFNHHNDVVVRYRAFYNRLARPGFAAFMRKMLGRLLERLRARTLRADGNAAVARFKDIVIQDGSSFALKRKLRDVFPGRFTTIEPAAVEIHATVSGFNDEVISVAIAPDTEAERRFLPEPSTLKNRLLLADRGYPSVDFFAAVREHGGAFIVRLTRSHDPWVRAAWVDRRRTTLRRPVPLSRFIAQHTNRRMDLDVEYERGTRAVRFRVIVLPGNQRTMTRLCTNLPRTPFSLSLISRLYRFRWQIRAPVQGVEVVREPAQVRHRQRTHRGRPHLGQPLRGGPQALSRSRRSDGGRRRHLDSPRRDVRRPHRRRDRDRPRRGPQHRHGLRRRDRLLARKRPSLKPGARSQDGPPPGRPLRRRGEAPSDHLWCARQSLARRERRSRYRLES